MCAIVIAIVGALGFPFDFCTFSSYLICAFRFSCSYSAALPYVPQMTVLMGVDGLFGIPKEYAYSGSIIMLADFRRSWNVFFGVLSGNTTSFLANYLKLYESRDVVTLFFVASLFSRL